MGYYINQVDNIFTIKKENIQKAWDSLVALFKIEKYSWINTDDVLNAKSFEDAMSEARWDVEKNESGDINAIYFNGEKYGDEEIILSSIAPYVENGSYSAMQGEEGERWKWKFVDGVIEEVNGKWIWDDEE